jgi:DNA-binding NtrC family response regulator
MAGSLSELSLPVVTTARAARILVVDDDPAVGRSISHHLASTGYQFINAETGEAALDLIRTSQPDLVLLDVMLPGLDGLETLRRLRASHPDLPVIVMTTNHTVETAIEAMKLTANDFITRPFDTERLCVVVRNALERGSLSRELAQLRRELSGRYSFTEIIGADGGLKETVRLLEKALPTDLTVLLTGESGTGKELFARAIHYEGPRRAASFVAINCAALPENLLESELFGYERGVFAGATKSRTGKLEAARGGTLFLDEVGEISPAIQVKLLRALQERTVTRVGGVEPIPIDVRVICASSRDLSRAVNNGDFREDLFQRISEFPLAIPPLRERLEDLPALAKSVLRQAAQDRPVSIHPTALSLLENYRWPGNVRELQNVLRRALVLANGDAIRPEHLPANIQGQSRERASETNFNGAVSFLAGNRLLTLDELERQHILHALEVCRGNLSQVARTLDIGRTTLYRKLQRYGVAPRE